MLINSNQLKDPKKLFTPKDPNQQMPHEGFPLCFRIQPIGRLDLQQLMDSDWLIRRKRTIVRLKKLSADWGDLQTSRLADQPIGHSEYLHAPKPIGRFIMQKLADQPIRCLPICRLADQISGADQPITIRKITPSSKLHCLHWRAFRYLQKFYWLGNCMVCSI